jgi:serine/threonine protein kinase
MPFPICIGATVNNYRIEVLIGSGGMGEVYLAEEALLGRKVAIKVLNPLLTREEQFRQRFVNEARIQANLQHPNIVGLYSFFEQDSTYFMALEYAEGITLKDLIARIGPIPEPRVKMILLQILNALQYAHAKGIIHRDIKPSNIMVDANDNIKIMDFGIARIMGDSHLTKTGLKVGTLFYMSPEQIVTPKEVDYKTDIYSTGIVLYEMLTGQLPFNTDTESDFVIQKEIVDNNLPDPKSHYPHISDNLIKLVYWMTAKDINKRPKLEEIISILTGKQPESDPKPTQVIPPKTTKSKNAKKPYAWASGDEQQKKTQSAEVDYNVLKQKKKGYRGLLIIIIIVILSAFAYPAYQSYKQDKDWQIAENMAKNGDRRAYLNYIIKYPHGTYIRDAKFHYELLLYEDILRNKQIKDYEEYFREFPNGSYISGVKADYDKILWEETKSQNTKEAFQNYLSKSPQGKYVKNAKTNLNFINYNNVWLDDYGKALSLAKMYHKPILLVFLTTLEDYSPRLSKEVIETDTFFRYVQTRYILVKFTASEYSEYAGLSGAFDFYRYPYVMVQNENGIVTKRIEGYKSGGSEAYIDKYLR